MHSSCSMHNKTIAITAVHKGSDVVGAMSGCVYEEVGPSWGVNTLSKSGRLLEVGGGGKAGWSLCWGYWKVSWLPGLSGGTGDHWKNWALVGES